MVEQIRERLSNGFRAFTICLSDGRKFPIPHRDFIAFTPRVVVVIDQNDISHTLNPLHIVSLEETI